MTVYYVSNSGNDSNDGLSTSTPWQTCAKVNAFSFSAGDTVLFNRGDIWREILEPISDDITIAGYGSGELPIFCGSDAISSGSFSQHSGDTYKVTVAVSTEHDVVYAGRFLELVADVATVGTTPSSYYHDGADLYINVGGAPAQDVENCVRNKSIYINELSNVRVRNLRTQNTMRDGTGSPNAGYGIFVFQSQDILVSDCKALRHQKHHMGDISSRNVVWRRCYASQVGNNIDESGATHYVSYGSSERETNGYSRWLACTTGDCLSPDGTERYSFIAHGDAIRRLLVRNCNFNSGINYVNQADSETQAADEWRIEYSSFNGKILLGVTQENAVVRGCVADEYDDQGAGNASEGNTIG